MNLDVRIQRVFDGVELVSGVGTPSLGQMCVMSFVAYLAGEGHTDRPACASPLIASFAIPLNDQMPRDVRQRLKPFAPRIIGTNDGLDELRAEVLRRALVEEILPKAVDRYRAAAGQDGRRGPVGRFWIRLRRREFQHRIDRLLAKAESNTGIGSGLEMASTAGRLIGLCARDAPTSREAEWYWNEGIGLLDRLCDVGASHRHRANLRMDRLEALEHTLAARRPTSLPSGTPSTLDALLSRIRDVAKATDKA